MFTLLFLIAGKDPKAMFKLSLYYQFKVIITALIVLVPPFQAFFEVKGLMRMNQVGQGYEGFVGAFVASCILLLEISIMSLDMDSKNAKSALLMRVLVSCVLACLLSGPIIVDINKGQALSEIADTYNNKKDTLTKNFDAAKKIQDSIIANADKQVELAQNNLNQAASDGIYGIKSKLADSTRLLLAKNMATIKMNANDSKVLLLKNYTNQISNIDNKQSDYRTLLDYVVKNSTGVGLVQNILLLLFILLIDLGGVIIKISRSKNSKDEIGYYEIKETLDNERMFTIKSEITNEMALEALTRDAKYKREIYDKTASNEIFNGQLKEGYEALEPENEELKMKLSKIHADVFNTNKNSNHNTVEVSDDADNPFAVNSELIKITFDIIKDAKSELEKITLIYNYVHENVRYDTNFIKNDFYRNPITTLLKHKLGVCGEMAALIVVTARIANLNAWYVSVTECADGSKEPHACALVMVEGEKYFVDPAQHQINISHKQFEINYDDEVVKEKFRQWNNKRKKATETPSGN